MTLESRLMINKYHSTRSLKRRLALWRGEFSQKSSAAGWKYLLIDAKYLHSSRMRAPSRRMCNFHKERVMDEREAQWKARSSAKVYAAPAMEGQKGFYRARRASVSWQGNNKTALVIASQIDFGICSLSDICSRPSSSPHSITPAI